MDLPGHYSNHDLQGSLSRLAKKLAALRASLGGGLRAVGSGLAVLAGCSRPLSKY
jgi:hypothetical protein